MVSALYTDKTQAAKMSSAVKSCPCTVSKELRSSGGPCSGPPFMQRDPVHHLQSAYSAAVAKVSLQILFRSIVGLRCPKVGVSAAQGHRPLSGAV